jgi:hypothetical protein
MMKCPGQDSRNAKMKDRYQKEKLMKFYVAAGFQIKFASKVAQIVCDNNPELMKDWVAPTTFSPHELRVWFAKNTETDPNTKNVMAFVKEAKTTSNVQIETKITSTNASMMNDQNVAWTGLLCVVEGKWPDGGKQFAKHVPELKDLMYSNDVGASAWLNVCKANHFRFGPNCHPLAGFAQFISVETAAMYLITLPIEPLLTQGIALPDLASFLETQRGEAFSKAHVRVYAVDVGDVLFVPNGFLTIPLFSNADVKQSWGHLWTFPVFQKEWANSMSSECKRSLASFHRSHFNDSAGRRMWKDRATLFEEYMRELGVPAPLASEV